MQISVRSRISSFSQPLFCVSLKNIGLKYRHPASKISPPHASPSSESQWSIHWQERYDEEFQLRVSATLGPVVACLSDTVSQKYGPFSKWNSVVGFPSELICGLLPPWRITAKSPSSLNIRHEHSVSCKWNLAVTCRVQIWGRQSPISL